MVSCELWKAWRTRWHDGLTNCLIHTFQESISALFRTNFRTEYPFDPIELIVFSFIGASCGFLGAGYIKFHREIVHFFRRHEGLNKFFQKKWVPFSSSLRAPSKFKSHSVSNNNPQPVCLSYFDNVDHNYCYVSTLFGQIYGRHGKKSQTEGLT